MSKPPISRVFNLAFRLAVITSLVILSFLPAPFLDGLGLGSGARVANAYPVISATKVDQLVVDNDGDNMVDPGDTIRYTVIITNSGTSNAGSTTFNDTIDANTTLGGPYISTFKTTPIARNDQYSSLGNVGITVSAVSGVLANDNDPDGGSVSVIPAAGGTANGGAFAIGADGSFSYQSPAGFEGTDSFTYTIQDSDGNLDPATVSIVVNEVIWFIDNTASSGNGRLGNPFNSLGAFNSSTAVDPGDAIFVYSGSGAYTGGIVLQSNQLLIGQGASATIETITGITPPTHSDTLPATGGSKPTLTNAGGNGVVLASGNLIRGLTVSNTGGAGLTGSGVNTLTVQEVSVSNATGNGIQLTNLSGTATFDNLSVIGSNARNVLIENNTGTATIGLTNSTVNTAGSDGFAVIGRGSANVTLNVSGSTFTHNAAVQLKVHAEQSSTVGANITGNSFDGEPTQVGNVGVDLAVRDSANLTFDVLGLPGVTPQTFLPFRSHAINVYASGGGIASGRIKGNSVNGSEFGAGVRVVAQVTDVGGLDPAITAQIEDNDINNIKGAGLAGIHIVSRDGSSGLSGTANVQATLVSNVVGIDGADSVIQGQANGGNTLCLDVTFNTANGALTSPFAGFGSTHYIGNPVPGDPAGPGTVVYANYQNGNLGGTWNFNSNLPTLGSGNAGEAYVDGTEPVDGTCATVAGFSPGDNGAVFAQSDDTLLLAREGMPVSLAALAAPLVEAVAGVDVPAPYGTVLETTRTLAAALASAFQATPAHASGENLNVTLGTLNAGQEVVIAFEVTVDSTIPANVAQVCNQGLFQGDNFFDVLTDDPDVGGAADPTCTLVEVSAVDLQIRKLDSGVPVAAGQVIQYSITVTNTGQVAATGVLITETVPLHTTFDEGSSTSGWSCADGAPAGTECVFDVGVSGALNPDQNVQLTFAVQVDSSVPAFVPHIENTVETGDDGAAGPDANPTDNSATVQTLVIAAPDLQVRKSAAGTAPPGSTLSYTIVYTNAGSRASNSTILSETVPAYTTWDPASSAAGWACNPASGVAGTNCTINVGTVSGAGGGDSVVFAVTVDSPLPAGVTETTNHVDIYGISSAPDSNPADNRFTLVSVINGPPEITGVAPAGQTVQYSDQIAPVTITAADTGPDALTLSTTSLPNNLSLSGASCGAAAGGGRECTWTLDGQMLQAAGTYTVEVTASDGTLTSEPATITLTVEHEDATVAFAGANPVSVPVASDGGNSGPFTLAVNVTEFDNPDNVSGDANLAGDISLADVTMTLAPVGPGSSENATSCTTSTGPGLSDPDSPFGYDILTVSCRFEAVSVNTYAVQVNIGGDTYAGSGEDVLVVYDPSLGFTTGGGWFYWPGTADAGAGYPGDRTNFGYTMKYSKKATKAQGSLLVIRHLPDGTKYHVKSNALDGLALGDEGDYGWATFSGKATYLEPGWPEPVGNHRFVAYAVDNGDAGADEFWLEAMDRDGNLVTLSLDREAVDNTELLQGGNVLVPHGGGGKGRGK